MAIPFLNHLDLRSVSELQNAILHKTTQSSASDVEGKIIYDTGTDTIKFYSGTSGSGQWISLSGDTNTFRTVEVDTDGNNSANNTLDPTETLRFKKGTNIGLTEADGVITISSTDTNTQNQYSLAVADSTTKIRLSGSGHDGATTNDVEIVGSGATTVTRTNANKLTISSTNTNTDTLQSVADSSSSSEHFVTFVANAAGAQTAGSDSTFLYIPSTETLKVTNLIVSGDTTTSNETVKVVTDNTLQFEGASGTAADKELNLTTAVLTGDRTQTLQNATGTIALLSDITGTNSNTNTGDQNLFSTIAVSGQNNVVADSTSDTLTFAAGSNVTITTADGSDTVTIAADNTNTQLSTASALIDVSAMDDTPSNRIASFSHGLASKNLIVQMHDVTTGHVVYADVDHTSSSAISITFASIPTNDIRVVVIDAKDGLTDKTVTYS